MIKRLAEKMLRSFGVDIPNPPQPTPSPPGGASSEVGRASVVDALARDPLNAGLHLQLALEASKAGWRHLAYAECKTALHLGAEREAVEGLLNAARQALPDPIGMNHNQYFRFITLSSEIRHRAGRADPSILDVGGGDGRLASFIPDASYCLAEPSINGISGTDLPFPDRSFDYVVSCHVLEHITVDERTTFLDQMLAKSRRGIILLNPFHVEGTHVDERLRLVIEITGAQWAREHLDCSLPKVDDVRRYAGDRGLEISVKPNGTLATTMAFVFLDHFAGKSGRDEDWRKVNAFFNEKYIDILDSPQYPNAYLIYLGRPRADRT